MTGFSATPVLPPSYPLKTPVSTPHARVTIGRVMSKCVTSRIRLLPIGIARIPCGFRFAHTVAASGSGADKSTNTMLVSTGNTSFNPATAVSASANTRACS